MLCFSMKEKSKAGYRSVTDSADEDAVELCERGATAEDTLEVRVLTTKGSAHVLTVRAAGTVETLAQAVEDELGAEKKFQRLIYSGRILDSMTMRLSDIPILPSTTVHLVVRTAAPAGSEATKTEETARAVEYDATGIQAASARVSVVHPLLRLGAQRVKLLSSMLLLLFGLRSLLLMAIFVSNFGGSSSDSDDAAGAQVLRFVDLMINLGGLWVGAKGLRAAAQFSSEVAELYCRGLVSVALLSVGLRLWELIALMTVTVHEAPSAPGDGAASTEYLDDAASARGGDDDAIPSSASTSSKVFAQTVAAVIVAAFWAICVCRAVQYRRLLLLHPISS